MTQWRRWKKIVGFRMKNAPPFFSDDPAQIGFGAGEPLSDLIALLRPQAVLGKLVTAGEKGDGNNVDKRWAVRHSSLGSASFCVALAGQCLLEADGEFPLALYATDFVLLPAIPAFTLTGGSSDLQALCGAFRLDGTNPGLLAPLLPAAVHSRGSGSLARLVVLVAAELRDQLPGREAMISRLVEQMLVDAMRQTMVNDPPPGLLCGLGDLRLVSALEHMHARLHHPWTIDELAGIAGLSRSAFHDRFTRKVGKPPMEHLQSWRMEIAKDLLRAHGLPVSEVAVRVGYGSTSAFSVAFSKQVGQSPLRYARANRPAGSIRQ